MKKLLFLLFILPIGSFAQQACDAPEFRQFDFWIGEWDVYLNDTVYAGESKVSLILDSCVIFEEWSSKNLRGKSLNSYSPSRKQWMQTWVDSQGGTVHFAGHWDGESIALEGKGPEDSYYLMIFTPLKDGKVRQVWKLSQDQCETWVDIFNGLYIPKK